MCVRDCVSVAVEEQRPGYTRQLATALSTVLFQRKKGLICKKAVMGVCEYEREREIEWSYEQTAI